MGMVQDCPRCRMVSPPEAQRCDCGYDFVEGQVLQTYLTEKDQDNAKKNPVNFHSSMGFGVRYFLKLIGL